jgi:DNA polymerase-3 subunit delta
MTFEQIISDIHKKKYAPIYFLMGDEPYFIDMISDTIEDEVLDETEKAFNQIVVYGRDVDIDTVATHAKSYSMMGGYMVVIVKEAQDLKNIEDFEKYIDVIPSTTILVFDYKYKKLDKRRALAKKIDKVGVLFESKKLYDNNIPGWIQGYLSEKGYGITPKAAQMLADFLGTDLHKIRNELEKLIIAVPRARTLNDEDVERNIGISKDFNISELQNALGRRDALKAYQIVNYFGDNTKENPLLVIAIALYNYFTRILKVHYASDPSQNALASQLGVNPYFVRDYQMAARNYNIADCVRCISVLREFNLKGVGYNNGETTEKDLYREMVFKLLNRV